MKILSKVGGITVYSLAGTIVLILLLLYVYPPFGIYLQNVGAK